MTVVINTGAGELTAGQLGEQAAQAVRALNHLTRPGVGALTDPVDAAVLTAALARVTGGLPQLADQLASWLTSQGRAGRLRVDACSGPDPAGTDVAVTQATAALAQAGQHARRASHALDAAHQTLTILAAAPAGHANKPEDRP